VEGVSVSERGLKKGGVFRISVLGFPRPRRERITENLGSVQSRF